MWVLRDLVGAG